MYSRLFACALLIASSPAISQITAPSNPSALRMDNSKVAAPAVPYSSPVQVGPERMTNETVITLVRAGLGPEAVIAKINSSVGTYDSSTDSLIRLKQAGVPDPVIAAMLTRSKSPVLTNALADNANANPLSPHSPGIYLMDPSAGRMIRIDPTVSNQVKTSGLLGYAFSYGLASMKLKSVIPNPGARVQSVGRRPVFYFFFNQSGPLAEISGFGSSFAAMTSSPNEFSLVRFEQKRDHREASVGSFNLGGMKTGISDKARVSFSYDDVAPGVFRVSPSADLPPGQYGFVSSMSAGSGAGFVARIFDFSVS